MPRSFRGHAKCPRCGALQMESDPARGYVFCDACRARWRTSRDYINECTARTLGGTAPPDMSNWIENELQQELEALVAMSKVEAIDEVLEYIKLAVESRKTMIESGVDVNGHQRDLSLLNNMVKVFTTVKDSYGSV